MRKRIWVSDKKVIPRDFRDQRRIFRGRIRQALDLESQGQCAHPMCDGGYLSVEAHHIILHSRGGLTSQENGLLLCRGKGRCHNILHDVTPIRLAFEIKRKARRGINACEIRTISPDELIAEAGRIHRDYDKPISDKFTELNDVLIHANFLQRPNDRFYVFTHVLLTKASILSDGVSPEKSDLKRLLLLMSNRRGWAITLANKAAKYADLIHDPWLKIRALHIRAVSFNARSQPLESAMGHNRLVNYICSLAERFTTTNVVQSLIARSTREKAVCLGKSSARSFKSTALATGSLEFAEAEGKAHDIDDALIRCCEAYAYAEQPAVAHRYLDKLLSNWTRMDSNLQAITRKMHSKIAVIQNDLSRAEEIIERGLEFSKTNHIYHQVYHFSRLRWQLHDKSIDNRSKIIT